MRLQDHQHVPIPTGHGCIPFSRSLLPLPFLEPAVCTLGRRGLERTPSKGRTRYCIRALLKRDSEISCNTLLVSPFSVHLCCWYMYTTHRRNLEFLDNKFMNFAFLKFVVEGASSRFALT